MRRKISRSEKCGGAEYLFDPSLPCARFRSANFGGINYEHMTWAVAIFPAWHVQSAPCARHSRRLKSTLPLHLYGKATPSYPILVFFLSGPSSSSSLRSAYMVLGCVCFHAFVNNGSFSAFSAYLSSASRGSSSRIELSGM